MPDVIPSPRGSEYQVSTVLEQMRAAKPRDGMNPEQQSEWIAEHQRLMDQVMEQMMMQYHLLMQELRR